MVNFKLIGMYIVFTAPAWLMVLVSFDAPLVLGRDVFLFSLLQVILVGILFYWKRGSLASYNRGWNVQRDR